MIENNSIKSVSIVSLVILSVVSILVGVMLLANGLTLGLSISWIGITFAPAIIYKVLTSIKNKPKSK